MMTDNENTKWTVKSHRVQSNGKENKKVTVVQNDGKVGMSLLSMSDTFLSNCGDEIERVTYAAMYRAANMLLTYSNSNMIHSDVSYDPESVSGMIAMISQIFSIEYIDAMDMVNVLMDVVWVPRFWAKLHDVEEQTIEERIENMMCSEIFVEPYMIQLISSATMMKKMVDIVRDVWCDEEKRCWFYETMDSDDENETVTPFVAMIRDVWSAFGVSLFVSEIDGDMGTINISRQECMIKFPNSEAVPSQAADVLFLGDNLCEYYQMIVQHKDDRKKDNLHTIPELQDRDFWISRCMVKNATNGESFANSNKLANMWDLVNDHIDTLLPKCDNPWPIFAFIETITVGNRHCPIGCLSPLTSVIPHQLRIDGKDFPGQVDSLHKYPEIEAELHDWLLDPTVDYKFKTFLEEDGEQYAIYIHGSCHDERFSCTDHLTKINLRDVIYIHTKNGQLRKEIPAIKIYELLMDLQNIWRTFSQPGYSVSKSVDVRYGQHSRGNSTYTERTDYPYALVSTLRWTKSNRVPKPVDVTVTVDTGKGLSTLTTTVCYQPWTSYATAKHEYDRMKPIDHPLMGEIAQEKLGGTKVDINMPVKAGLGAPVAYVGSRLAPVSLGVLLAAIANIRYVHGGERKPYSCNASNLNLLVSVFLFDIPILTPLEITSWYNITSP
uniref:Uncharacterized protein n=1 Tax=viral metagenome TaxID=1070528 RepID=A0A2V0RC21_9ZZZZ